ncbi:MAG: hypothetical protein AMXMBFR84_37450 [Candidatus Hydrogenedentota bacterium]
MGKSRYSTMTVTDVIHAVLRRPDVDPKAISAALGCHPTTVYQMGEFGDNGQPRHHIKAWQVPLFCRAANDYDLLEFLDWQSGRPESTAKVTDMQVVSEAADVLSALTDAFKDGSVSDSEAKRIEKELQELNQVIVARLTQGEEKRASDGRRLSLLDTARDNR